MIKRLTKLLLPSFLLLTSCATKIESLSPSYSVEEQPSSFSDYDLINIWLDPFLQDGSKLLEELNGEPLEWNVVEGNARIEDYHLYKNEDAQEYEPIQLSVTLQDGQTYTFDSLLLLDPYVAYVISYFSENGDDKEQFKLAYTYNGTYWFKWNEDQAILKPTLGTKRLRDPFIGRKKDGTFILLATQGYDTDSIYAFDSSDLITFENERLLQVNSSTDDSMSQKQAWAPEAFYDRTMNQYIIYWSSVEDQRMFYNTTNDFVEFSYPLSLLDTGFPVIDGTIVKEGFDYYIILKDEQEPMSTHSQLFFGKSMNGWHQFNEFHSPFTGHQSEGPMVMKDLYVSGYFIIYDDYTRFQFQALKTEDLWNGPYKEIPSSEIMFPIIDPAHSSAIPVTWKELERLMDYYEGS